MTSSYFRRDLGEIHLGQLGEPRTQVRQARLDESLPLEGGMVVAVLTQVAVRKGLLQRVGKRDRKLVVEPAHFLGELLLDGFQHPGQPTCSVRKTP
jgi:hypothetical protein